MESVIKLEMKLTKTMETRGLRRLLLPYLSNLRRDSIGTDFQSVFKLTNYVCAKSLESRLRQFRNTYKQSGDINDFPCIRGWIAQLQRLKILPKVNRLGRRPNIS